MIVLGCCNYLRLRHPHRQLILINNTPVIQSVDKRGRIDLRKIAFSSHSQKQVLQDFPVPFKYFHDLFLINLFFCDFVYLPE